MAAYVARYTRLHPCLWAPHSITAYPHGFHNWPDGLADPVWTRNARIVTSAGAAFRPSADCATLDAAIEECWVHFATLDQEVRPCRAHFSAHARQERGEGFRRRAAVRRSSRKGRSLRIVRGDLLNLARQGEFDAIIHGCNCQCAMGKGIALAIKQQFPAAHAADLATSKGSATKLGTYSSATVETDAGMLTIVNAYTQFHYDAIHRVMRAIAHDFANARINYPKFGAGLAGGDWSVISAIIDTELEGLDHTYVDFAG
jgi:O-acetyl-ADP-ribose deacetylase (regulator of RNase III)